MLKADIVLCEEINGEEKIVPAGRAAKTRGNPLACLLTRSGLGALYCAEREKDTVISTPPQLCSHT